MFERITDPDPLRFAEMADSSWFDVLKNCRKMTIAAVNGIAVAAGAACAILCDASIAAESATFGFPEAKAGFAESHSTHLLWGRVSLTKIKYLVYSAKRISAAEAERIGMITEVVPDDRLYDRVREVVQEFRATSYDAKLLFKEYTNRMVPALEWGDMYRGFETKESLAFLEQFKNRKGGECPDLGLSRRHNDGRRCPPYRRIHGSGCSPNSIGASRPTSVSDAQQRQEGPQWHPDFRRRAHRSRLQVCGPHSVVGLRIGTPWPWQHARTAVHSLR